MPTEARSKGKRSRKGGKRTKKIRGWKEYRYCMIQVVFSDKQLKNPFSKSDLVYGMMAESGGDKAKITHLLDTVVEKVFVPILELQPTKEKAQ